MRVFMNLKARSPRRQRKFSGALLLRFVALLVGCQRAPTPSVANPPDAASPQPLEPVAEGASAPVEAWGEPAPNGAVKVVLEEDALRLGERRWKIGEPTAALQAWIGGKPVVISAPPELYLAQAAAALGALDDLGVEVWLAGATPAVAYPIHPMDAAAFATWLDAPKPGRLRIVQRADGLELQTSVGKLPGPDPNGPSLPHREGKVDVAGLRVALARLRGRFGKVDGLALVPSFGVELTEVTEALSGAYRAPGVPAFEPLLLVYPRPATRPPPP